jgi:uncharacterized protein (TIRG00374 family)
MIYKKYLLQVIKFLLFLGFGLGILYIVYRSQNTSFQADCAGRGIPADSCSLADKVLTDFGRVNYGYILLVLAAFMVSNVSRAIRMNMLLRPLGARPRLINTFLTTILGYLSNLALPRMGELVRAASLSRYEKIPVEKIMGAVVVDRVMDVLSILTITVIALLVERGPIGAFFSKHIPLEALLGGIGNLLFVLLVVSLVVLALVYLLRGPLMRSRFYQRIRAIAQGFWEGINAVRSLEKPWLFLLHTVNIWGMFFMMTLLCFWAFAPTAALSARSGLTVFVFGSWGVVVPSPAGMGTFHFMAQQALSIYGVSGDDGFSWANISFFSVNIGANVLVGFASLILLPIINRNYHPKALADA